MQNDIKSNRDNLSKIEKLRFRAGELTNDKKNNANSSVNLSQMKKLVIAQKNLSLVVQKLDDFLNVEKRLSDLKVLAEDPNNFTIVYEKLERLLQLQQPFIKNNQNNSKFSHKYKETLEFKEYFLERVYSVFMNYIKISIENVNVLKNSIEIVLNLAAKELGNMSKSQLFNNDGHSEVDIENFMSCSAIKKMIYQMEQATDQRFELNLGDKKDLGETLENIKFSIDDLLIIYEKTVPLFPEQMSIFSYVELHYKKNIDKLILPVLNNMEQLQENPGKAPIQYNNRLHHIFNQLVSEI